MKKKRIKISIIGMGQMGGSLGKALRCAALKGKYYIKGIDKDKKTLKAALKIGAADEVSADLNAAQDCDIAVICLPADLIAAVYEKLSKIVREDAVITDTGSVKEKIVKKIEPLFKKRHIVPAHPMAGREKNGIMSADAQMFKNANIVITESGKAARSEGYALAEKKVARMWKDTGAKIVKMPAGKHDEMAALTSHLPHIIAFCLSKIYKEAKRKSPEIDLLTAGSFKSMTRVSVSSADMWAPIFALNGGNVGKHLKTFIKELKNFEKSLNNQSELKKEILKTQA